MKNRNLLFIVILMLTACAPQIAPTPISPTTTPAPAMEASPVIESTITAEASPTLIPTATKFDGRLLFSRFNEASHTFIGMFVAQTDGSAETAVPLPGEEGWGRWSRSGKEIAVPTQLDDERIGTAIIASDGTVLRVLSIPDPTLNIVCTVWSGDDTRLACEGWDDTDSSRNGIYTVRASDGADLQRLTTPPAGKRDLPGDYSSDGQFVFKRYSGDEGPGPLMLVAANGGEPRTLYDGPMEDAGRFSPDGSFVVTSSGGSLMVIDLDGQVVHTISIDDHIAFGPAWSPDGTRIVFSLTTPGVFAADIYTSLPDGTNLQRVTNTAANEINVDWGVGSE
jgi:Tol biopolymer transport system component